MRMAAIPSSLLLCLATLMVLPAPGQAQTQAKTPETKPADDKPQESATNIVYKPPMRGAPARRVGGATRGGGDKDLVLHVLAPEETGWTEQAQPTLYWYISRPAGAVIELTLIADGAEAPALTRDVPDAQAGFHAMDLKQFGVTLRPDTDYEWFVSVVSDPGRRSRDVTSGGVIRRVAVDPAVQSRVAAADAKDAPGIYAQAGLWYDAIGALSDLIARNPTDAALIAERASLLKQVGLTRVAGK